MYGRNIRSAFVTKHYGRKGEAGLVMLLSLVFLSISAVAQPLRIAPGERWIEMWPDGISVVTILFQKNGYQGNKATVITLATVKELKTGEMKLHGKPATAYMQGDTGRTLAPFWLLGKKLEGIGILAVYFIDDDDNVISNVITIEAAAGKKAEGELRSRLGPPTPKEMTFDLQTILTTKEQLKAITDQVRLGDIVMTGLDMDVRYLASEKITEKNILSRVAKYAFDETISGLALQKLADQGHQDMLAEIAKDAFNRFIRVRAAATIMDPQILKNIINESKETQVRLAAVRNIADTALIASLVRSGTCMDVLDGLAQKLRDEHLLDSIARMRCPRCWDYHPGVTAVRNIRTQAVLEDIALHADDIAVRRSAIECLTDQHILAGIARNAQDYHQRTAAVLRLNDQDVLKEIVGNEKYLEVCTIAVEVMVDSAYLEYVRAKETRRELRNAAGKRLQDLSHDYMEIDFMADTSALARIARTDWHWHRRLRAVTRVQDQNVLAAIARTDHVAAVRLAAVQRLTSVPLLKEIQKNEQSEDVKSTATGRAKQLQKKKK